MFDIDGDVNVNATYDMMWLWWYYKINPVGEPHSDGLNSNLIKHSVQKL